MSWGTEVDDDNTIIGNSVQGKGSVTCNSTVTHSSDHSIIEGLIVGIGLLVFIAIMLLMVAIGLGIKLYRVSKPKAAQLGVSLTETIGESPG